MPKDEGPNLRMRGCVNSNSIPRLHTDARERSVSHLQQESTLGLHRPRRRSGRRGIGARLRCQVQLRPGWSEAYLFCRIRNSSPFIAALRPFPKLSFSDKLAQNRGHTSSWGGIASGNQSIHHVGGRRITVFRPDKVNNGIGQSLVLGNGLPQKSLKNSDGLPKLCTLALQIVDHLIKRFELF